MSDPITFYAQVQKVQTLADGGLRFTFDTGEMSIMQAAQLMACKVDGHVVDVVVTERQDDDDGTEKRRKSKF